MWSVCIYSIDSLTPNKLNSTQLTMMMSGIQGKPLEVTGKSNSVDFTLWLCFDFIIKRWWIVPSLLIVVVSCSKLKDTEWISRQDPYVCIEYASNKFRTRTCTGNFNPSSSSSSMTDFVDRIWIVDSFIQFQTAEKTLYFKRSSYFPLLKAFPRSMLSFGTAIPSPSMILSAPESNFIHFSTSYQSLSITLSHYSFSVLFYVRVQLHKVLSQGFDDSSWPLQTKSGRYIAIAIATLFYPPKL